MEVAGSGKADYMARAFAMEFLAVVRFGGAQNPPRGEGRLIFPKRARASVDIADMSGLV